MKSFAFVAVTALALTFGSAVQASAQHAHGGKGPNGGAMEDVAGVHAELLKKGSTVTFNILDEDNKPVSTKGYSGSVLIVADADRETVTLSPQGESSIAGEAKKPIAANATVTLMLKTAAGKTGQVRFKPSP